MVMSCLCIGIDPESSNWRASARVTGGFCSLVFSSICIASLYKRPWIHPLVSCGLSFNQKLPVSVMSSLIHVPIIVFLMLLGYGVFIDLFTTDDFLLTLDLILDFPWASLLLYWTHLGLRLFFWIAHGLHFCYFRHHLSFWLFYWIILGLLHYFGYRLLLALD